MSPSVERAFSFIEVELISIQRRYDILKELFGTEKEYVKLLNETAPHFFYLVQTGFFENIVLSIARLMDPPNTGEFKNLSVEKFIDILKEDICNEGRTDSSENKLIFELKLILECYLKCTTKILKNYRDKKIAHNDYDIFEKKAEFIDKITFQHLHYALASLRDFVNAVNMHFKGSKTVYTYPFDPLTSGLLKSLHLSKNTRNYLHELRVNDSDIPNDLIVDTELYNFKYDLMEKNVYKKAELNENDLELINKIKEESPTSLLKKIEKSKKYNDKSNK